MRLFFWRRKPEPEAAKERDLAALARAAALPASVGAVERSQLPTKPLAIRPIEIKDEVLQFARDYLHASGARVRVDEEDVISAVLQNGDVVRYTTSLARARADEGLNLLVYGGGSLAALIDESAERSRIAALRLATVGDPIAVAREAIVPPLPACERCADSTSDMPVSHSANCPINAGRFAFEGAGAVLEATLEERADVNAIELTYALAISDRHGRREESLRLAFDCDTVRKIDPLSLEIAQLALAADMPHGAGAQFSRVSIEAETMVRGALDATGAFLRARSLAEYQHRLDYLRLTFERSQRESGEGAEGESTYARELERLREIFTIALDARLESVAFIASPAARVSLRFSSGATCALWVDIGRNQALPPSCTSCGKSIIAGSLCSSGHFTCPDCRRRHVSGCPACAGVFSSVDALDTSAAVESETAASSDALTLHHLAAMTQETWHLCVSWLLENDGLTIERTAEGGLGRLWHGTTADGIFVATAWRPDGAARWLGADEVRRAAALGVAGASVTIIAVATPTAEALRVAEQTHVRIIDSARLAALLRQHESAHSRELEQMALDRQQRIAEANSTRDSMFAAVQRVEEALASAVNSRRASGRAAVVSAVGTVTRARQLAQQGLLAWDTLLADWQAAFGDREARDGSLPIVATPEQLRQQGQRAVHLADVLTPACLEIASTPGQGELGYSPWRKAVLEELTARCEALRWRLAALDPIRAGTFDAARDPEALAQGEAATVAATHAAARVAKAQAQLEARARIRTSVS